MGDVKSHHALKCLILNNYFGVCGGETGIRTFETRKLYPIKLSQYAIWGCTVLLTHSKR
jgi:hypothetical protein